MLERAEMGQREKGKDVAARTKGRADGVHTYGGEEVLLQKAPVRWREVEFAAVIC